MPQGLRSLLAFALTIGTQLQLSYAAGRPPTKTSRNKSEAVADSPPPSGKSTGILDAPLRFRRVDAQDGLPVGVVHAMTQDKVGLVWLAIGTNLVRYDGVTAVLFPQDLDSSEGHVGDVLSLAFDSTSNVLWYAASESGLHEMDLNRGVSTRALRELEDGITSIFLDRSNVLWLLSSAKLMRCSTDAGEVRLDASFDIEATAVTQGPDGMLYVGTQRDGVYLMNAEGKLEKRYDVSGESSDRPAPVAALHFDSSGTLWIGTAGFGLHYARAGSKKVERYLYDPSDPTSISDNNIATLISDSKGRLWIGTRFGGLSELDPGETTFTRYRPDALIRDRLVSHGLISSMVDQAGVLWFGSIVGGISLVDETRISLATYRLLGSELPTALDQDPQGLLWVIAAPTGRSSAGLYRIDLRNRRYVLYQTAPAADGGEPIDFAQKSFYSLHADKSGKIWLGQLGGGLVRFEPKSETYARFLPDPGTEGPVEGANSITKIIDDGSRLWLGTWGGGLASFNRGDETFNFYEPGEAAAAAPSFIYALQFDPKDSDIIWIASTEGGVTRFNRKGGEFQSFLNQPNDPSTLTTNQVTAIYADGSGAVWAGTQGGGFASLDTSTGKAKRFHGKEFPRTVWSILPDAKGRLWMSTDGDGVIRFDTKTETLTKFTTDDGLSSNEYVMGSFTALAGGVLAFGAVGGIAVLKPDEVKTDEYSPAPLMSDFQVFNKPFEFDRAISTVNHIDLSYQQSVFSIHFAAPSFSAPARTRFEYMLDGFDEDWLPAAHNSATYTNMAPGTYKFLVRATNRHGVQGPISAPLMIDVEAPPWRRWWAYLIYGTIGLGLVAAYLRYQEQRVVALRNTNRLFAVEREFELTAAVQAGFLPRAPEVEADRMRLVGVYSPAEKCGGDWWWHEQIGATHWILVGDVTGHGVGSAMVTAAVGTSFRVLREGPTTMNPTERFALVNDEVVRVGDGRYQMALTAIELNTETGEMKGYFAGGLPILVFDAGGKVQVIAGRGTPLGSPDLHIGTAEVVLKPGNRIMLLTDGIPEMTTQAGRPLGMRQVFKLFEQTAQLPIADASRDLFSEMQRRKKEPQEDDWTFVLVEWSSMRAMTR